MATKVDRLFGLEWLKKRVDEAHKEAKMDAEDELSRLAAENGTDSVTSVAFGPDAGKFKYSQVKKKKVVEYHLADSKDFDVWCLNNSLAVLDFMQRHAEEFAKEWTETMGEVPDGISRVEYEEPAKQGPPKLYGFKPEVVEARMGANWLEGANVLLLGDGNE